MSPIIVVVLVVVVLAVYFMLRKARRKSVADSIPQVHYVDETLLDLVRTRQIRAATEYYQSHTGIGAEESEKAIRYLVMRPESLMLMVRLQDGSHAPLHMDDTMQNYLDTGRLQKAILHYMNATGADPREAQVAVYALATNPQMTFLSPKDSS